MVKYKLIKCCPNSPKLGSIIMDTNPNNGTQDMWFEENWGKGGSQSFMLSKSTNPEKYPEFWEKIEEKQPLFITEDGKEIFEDSDVWWVRTTFEDKTFCDDKPFEYGLFNRDWNTRSKSLRYKWFSTKEAAEKWIEENKPVYSKKQILNKIEEIYRKLSIEFLSDNRISVVNYCLRSLRDEIENDKT